MKILRIFSLFLFILAIGKACEIGYFDTANYGCVKQCPNDNPLMDNITSSPQVYCRSECPELAPRPVVSSTNHQMISCEFECPSGYIDMSSQGSLYCIPECSVDAPYRHNTVCVAECPLCAPYLDESTDILHPACLSSCKSSAPYIYSQPGEAPKCVVTCPETAPYVDRTQIYYTCTAQCPEGTQLITDSVSNAQICYVDKFPGEYGDHQLCSEKTPGCAECHPITGVCQRCEGFQGILSGNVCQCSEELTLLFDRNTNSFLCDNKVPNPELATLDSADFCSYTYLELKEYFFNLNLLGTFCENDQILSIFSCAHFNLDQIADIMIGLLTFLNQNLSPLQIDSQWHYQMNYKLQQQQDNINDKIFEIEGLYQKIEDNSIPEEYINKTLTYILKNWNQYKYPIHSFPQIYRFLNYYIAIGLIDQNHNFKSSLYKELYQVQITQEKIQETNSQSYVHFVMEELPFYNSINDNFLAYSQYFTIYPEEAKQLFIHLNESVSLIFPSFVSAPVNINLQQIYDQTQLVGIKEYITQQSKVLCANFYVEPNQYSICRPATIVNEEYFVLKENSALKIYSECDPIDIDNCVDCRSEKQCETCLNDIPSFSDENTLETYGKCKCVEGFFASGFETLVCIEIATLEWNLHNETIQSKEALDLEFYDEIFTVLQIDEYEVYSDYIEKLKSLMQAAYDSSTTIDLTYILTIMNMLKDKNIHQLYQYIYDLIIMISDNLTECDNTTLKKMVELCIDSYRLITDLTLRSNMYKAFTINYAGYQYRKCSTYNISYNGLQENIVYAIADAYNPNLEQIDEYACSSYNSESLISFEVNDSKMTTVLSLSDLKSCGFIETIENDLHIFSGQVIQIDLASQQLFYNTLKVAFNQNLDLSSGSGYYEGASVIEVIVQGSDKEIQTYFSATVELLQDDNSFNLSIELDSEITELYEIDIPNEAELKNLDQIISVPLTFIKQEEGKNAYLISLNLENAVSGRYNLSFSCVVNLQGRRILEDQKIEQAYVDIQKEIVIQKSEEQQNNDDQLVSEDPKEDKMNGLPTVGLVFIIIACALTLILIIVGLNCLRKKSKKQRQIIAQQSLGDLEEKQQVVLRN